jgi:bcr-type benzoyl-CoA reductase subunit C
MTRLEELLAELQRIAANPKKQFQRFLSEGIKVVGCMPYFVPEELVHAAGMAPFGLFGGALTVSDAKRYWPSFICSMLQTILELGIRGTYDGLTAVIIPALCDGLKGMDGNWRHGVGHIPVIHVAHAQNRKIDAGVAFTASQYRKIKNQLEALAGRTISDEDIAASVAVHNERRAVMRHFIDVVSKRPGLLKPSQRSAVFKSSFFMEAAEHAAKVRELTSLLEQQPVVPFRGPKLVTSGITADHSGLLDILDSAGITVVDDEITTESLRFRVDVPVTADPIIGLAAQIGDIEGCSVLFDPGKKRGAMLIELARACGADGVLLVQTKFCDPEEYDYVPLKRMLDKAAIPLLQVEIDLQTTNNEQARTAVDAFCESIR